MRESRPLIGSSHHSSKVWPERAGAHGGTSATNSERDAGAQADVALARARGRSNKPEGAGVRDVRPRVREVGMVQRVQEFAAELQADALGDGKGTEQAEVEVDEPRPAQRVASDVAELRAVLRGEGGR